MPKVYNKYRPHPTDAVYVGRPTKFGNPFSHQRGTQAQFQVATRQDAVDAYETWIFMPDQKWLREAVLEELRGKDLLCWCAPLDCHADILLKIANAV